MKILIAAAAALGFAASPVLAQDAPPSDTGTNTMAPESTPHHATHHAKKHHASHCTCASNHKGTMHHHTAKTTSTTKKATTGR
jgi:hypothetical protein